MLSTLRLFLLGIGLVDCSFRLKTHASNRSGHEDSRGTAKAEDPAGTPVTRRLKLSPQESEVARPVGFIRRYSFLGYFVYSLKEPCFRKILFLFFKRSDDIFEFEAVPVV